MVIRLSGRLDGSMEGELHRRPKRAGCRWLWERGYAAIAEEVRVPAVGIIDVAAAGKWRRFNPRRVAFTRVPQVDRFHIVFVECKAHRSDFLSDQGRQYQFAFAVRERANRRRSGRPYRPPRASPALGKFDTCLVRPHANLHYLLTPPGLLKLKEVPRRWGWLVYQHDRVCVVRRPAWQEVADVTGMEGPIARSLTTANMQVAERSFVRSAHHPVAPALSAS